MSCLFDGFDCEDSGAFPLDSIPRDVLNYMFTWLDLPDFAKLSLMSHRYHHAVAQHPRYTSLKDTIARVTSGVSLDDVPLELRTEEVCIAALKHGNHNIPYLTYWTPRVCNILVRRGVAYNMIPRKYQSYDLLAMWGKLGCIPKRQRTRERCIMAIRAYVKRGCMWKVLKNVPIIWRRYHFYAEAISVNDDIVNELTHRPSSERAVYYDIVVSKRPEYIRYIPGGFRTQEMCVSAFAKDIQTFVRIPSEFKTREMCFKATVADMYLLSFVPNEIRTLEFLVELLPFNGCAIKHIPEDLITIEMVEVAATENIAAYRWAPFGILTYEYCTELVTRDWNLLQYVPGDHKDMKLCEIAYAQSPDAKKYMLSWIAREFHKREE